MNCEGDKDECPKIEAEVKLESELAAAETAPGADTLDMDDNRDDIDSVKSETTHKKLRKSVKRKKRTLKMKSRSKSSKKILKVERSVKQKRGLQKIRNIEEMELEILPRQLPRKRVVDNDNKAFRNTATIIENSYVCPFDTSYSDYYCIYCREVFTDPDKLREHNLTHDAGSFTKCDLNKKFLQVDVYRIDCRLCDVKINTIETLKEHLKDIHSVNLYNMDNEFLKFRLTNNNLKCYECGASFSFFHALKKHMAEHFGTCICDICGAHYFEERMLLLHQKTHQKIEENHTCEQCGKIFKSKHSRYIHETRIHKKEPVYQCTKCDEVLFSYSLRYRHMMEVHGEQRLFHCDHCDRAYDSRKSLREHNRRYHLKIYKHQCDLCDKRFYLPSRLKEHMATHTGERNFRCEYCGKSYPRLRSLKVHMQSHSSEKKYRCTLCNASFTQNVNLKNHMKRQHQSLDMEDGYHE
ncbi:hypothetical protein K1T71_014616 [Dendrolimus kikuchii]|uniref:Uncharacterized protein n=1 Tax=Dendrolimus kikuchii TaxID=765133 RepID=A0ACC1CEI8_9NEOP|nr:hypothetical protein K1T71_014616 [Dendrolimus kikuchii]